MLKPYSYCHERNKRLNSFPNYFEHKFGKNNTNTETFKGNMEKTQ